MQMHHRIPAATAASGGKFSLNTTAGKSQWRNMALNFAAGCGIGYNFLGHATVTQLTRRRRWDICLKYRCREFVVLENCIKSRDQLQRREIRCKYFGHASVFGGKFLYEILRK